MCRKPFGSGGKRVVTGRPKRPVATSSSTSSRMKLLRGVGVVSFDTDAEVKASLNIAYGASTVARRPRGAGAATPVRRILGRPLAADRRPQLTSGSLLE